MVSLFLSSWRLVHQRPLDFPEMYSEMTGLGHTLSFAGKTMWDPGSGGNLKRLSPPLPVTP